MGLGRLEMYLLTILKDSLNVEAIGGTRLVVGTPLEICSQFPRPTVINYSGIALIDRV